MMTTAHREIFGVDLDLRIFKRWGCLVYVRMDKSERNKFGAHGLFGVLLGLHGYKFEDWTYEVYVFRTKGIRHTRDLVFIEKLCRGCMVGNFSGIGPPTSQAF